MHQVLTGTGAKIATYHTHPCIHALSSNIPHTVSYTIHIHNMTCENHFAYVCLLVFKSNFKFKGPFGHRGCNLTDMYICIYIHIVFYVEREGEMYMCVCMYVCMYIYIYIYIS